MLRVTVVLVCAAAVWQVGEARPAKQLAEVTPSPAASALIDAPTKLLGETAGQIVSLLRREPDRSELTAIGSTQHAIRGALLRLEYPGMLITLHVDTLGPSSRLFRLDITDMDWLDTKRAVSQAAAPFA